MRGDPPRFGHHRGAHVIGLEQRLQRADVRDLQLERIGKGAHQFLRQPRQIEVTAEPRLGLVEPLGHVALTPAVIEPQRLEIITRPFQIAEILARAVFQVRNAERLLVGKVADLDQIADFGMVVGAQPTHRPMPPRAADHLELMLRIARHAAHDRGHFLLALRQDALDQVAAARLVERAIIAVMPPPDAAPRRIDQFLRAVHHRARGQIGQPVGPPGQHAHAQPRAAIAAIALGLRGRHQIGHEALVLGAHRSPFPPVLQGCNFCWLRPALPCAGGPDGWATCGGCPPRSRRRHRRDRSGNGRAPTCWSSARRVRRPSSAAP